MNIVELQKISKLANWQELWEYFPDGYPPEQINPYMQDIGTLHGLDDIFKFVASACCGDDDILIKVKSCDPNCLAALFVIMFPYWKANFSDCPLSGAHLTFDENLIWITQNLKAELDYCVMEIVL